jgi:hypothetical protein
MNPETLRHPEPDPPSSSPADFLPFSILRAIGSLWFAAVLLVMLLVAMSCGTVFESSHSPEQALRTFYLAWWFKSLLGLLAVNSLAAIVLKYPFSRRQFGFVLTHASILIILAGALVSELFGVNGQVSIAEGQSVDRFDNLGREVITVTNPRDRATTDLALGRIFGGFAPVDKPSVPIQTVGNLELEILRYVPDSDSVERVVDDATRPNCAVEVSLSANDRGTAAWVFQNQSAPLGALTAGFRLIPAATELAKLIDEHPSTQPASAGIVKIDYNGATFKIPVESCMDKPAPVGNTGYTVRVLRYLPHAIVGQDGQIANVSDRPVNPFVEAELSGPGGTERRLSFARFPEFTSMHSAMQKGSATSQPSSENLKLTLVTSAALGPNTPIEVLGGPDGKLYVRFAREDGSWTTRKLSPGEPVETPWPGRTFSLLRRYDRARLVRSVNPVEPVRPNRTPAILVKAGDRKESSEVWLRKDDAQTVEAGGQPWSLAYANETVPLGFKLTLNRFRVGLYPGENSPRSFESHISITEPLTGREENKIISMNQPVTFGGFSLFQSSYHQGDGQATSVLSVARDPGQRIVFFGYIAVLHGMVIVLITRMRDRRLAAVARAATAKGTRR